MNDQILVRVRNRVTNLLKQPEPGCQVQLFSVDIDRHPVDVLHHQVRLAVCRMTRIEQPRDSRVGQCRENLPLPQETVPQYRLIPARPQELDRHLLAYFAVRALGQIDGPHAAPPDEALEPVGLAVQYSRSGRRAREGHIDSLLHHVEQVAGGSPVVGQQGFDLAADPAIYRVLLKIAGPLLAGQVRQFVKQK